MQKITPCLWFNRNAEEAVAFYSSIFPDSHVLDVTRYGNEGPGPEGTVLTMRFRLADQEFIALNGGPEFVFSEAISFSVDCRDQTEVDELWQKLTADGGEESMCGWLKDKYGLSWQIVPSALPQLLDGSNPARANRVMSALLQMKKLDIAALQRAYDGAAA